MTDKKYVEIRFRMPIEDFEPYEQEAKELKDKHNIETSGTARVKAEAQKQAQIKRGKLNKSVSTDDFEDVMAVFKNI